MLARPVYGKPLVFLDTAASAQKPQAVIDAVSAAYGTDYANIHRGVYYLSQKSTEAYDAARARIARFIGAAEPAEIIFTRNATEAINLVAYSYGRTFLKAGDEVVLSEMEHHANIVPWQILREAIGIELKIVPIDEAGELDMEAYKAALGGQSQARRDDPYVERARHRDADQGDHRPRPCRRREGSRRWLPDGAARKDRCRRSRRRFLCLLRP